LSLVVYFWLLLKACLFSTGGFGNVPSLHSDLLARGWATEREFGEALAVGQISPGPNGLWIISLGYLMAGVSGAILALVAIIIPPLLILVVNRFYRRVQHHPAVEGFVRGLSLAVVGIFVVVMLRLLHGVGLEVKSVLIALASIGLGVTGRVPVVVILALAAGSGLVLY
jgi:chromate transporter